MDIRIIKIASDEKCIGLEKDNVLSVQKIHNPESKAPFSKVRMFLYQVDTNQRTEIAPEIPKYNVGELKFGEKQKNLVYFFSITKTQNHGEMMINLHAYDIYENTNVIIFSFIDDIVKYKKHKQLKIFILNETYIYVQFARLVENYPQTCEDFLAFEKFLYDVHDKIQYDIVDNAFLKHGIDDMIPITNNVCALKQGFSLHVKDRFETLTKADAPIETVCLISITQFISEITVPTRNFTMEIIDQSYFENTIAYLKRKGTYLLYSKINRDTLHEEVCYYNFLTKEVFSCINQSYAKTNEHAQALILKKNPYIVNNNDYVELYNLSTNTTDVRFIANTEICATEFDLIITHINRKKRFTKKITPIYEIYRYPKMQFLNYGKGTSVQCIRNKKEAFYMFVQYDK